jgi:hypothetical protein
VKGQFDLDVVTAGAFDGFVTANLNVAEALAAKVAQDLAVAPVMNGAPRAIPQTGASQRRAVIDLATLDFQPRRKLLRWIIKAPIAVVTSRRSDSALPPKHGRCLPCLQTSCQSAGAVL